jgi:glycerol-3-phosphate dehydrogenase (NAD(P)+)
VSGAPRPAVAVLGAGNWGTVIAHLAARNGCAVRLLCRDPERCREIAEEHTNRAATPGLVLAQGITPTTRIGDAVQGAELVIVAVPAQSFRGLAVELASWISPSQAVLHAAKGLELGTCARMSEILGAETCVRQLGVLSGPNIAAEIAEGKPAGTLIASGFPRVIRLGRRALGSAQLMVFSGSDVLGVEIAGALKNVVALAAGMADEMGVGDNAKALLLTRGLAEMTSLAVAMGAQPATLAGLAGIGDLSVTCSSPRSRNHRVGAALARGERLDDVLRGLGMVAEGVPTSRAARSLAAGLGVATPLFDRVHRVLHDGLPPADALHQLMRLPADAEGWGAPSTAARARPRR